MIETVLNNTFTLEQKMVVVVTHNSVENFRKIGEIKAVT